MANRPLWIKLPRNLLLLLLLLLVTASFSQAETVAAAPLGSIVASGYATIGNAAAPTGTTIFAGDQVTSKEPALIYFTSGSRIEMTKATANFSRHGKALVVQVDQGLLRFNFNKGEEVQIDAGEYRFTTVSNIGHTGELGLNRSGQIAMNVLDGTFKVLNTATGKQTEVSSNSPFEVMAQSGQGSVSRNGESLTDRSLILKPNELKGKCVVVRSKAYAIKGNSDTDIKINGTWDLKTGKYAYKVVECTEEAMIQAGASEKAAHEAALTSVFGVPPAPEGGHTVRNAAIIAGVGGAIGLPLAIKSLKGDEPSPSSR